MTDLLPCPHCGGRMNVRGNSAFHPTIMLRERECWLATAGDHGGTFELNSWDYSSWNTRPTPDPVLAEIAAERDVTPPTCGPPP